MENYYAKYDIYLLRNIYLMTNCEIATLIGVKPLTVSRWNSGWPIKKEHYEKLEKIKCLLAKKNIRYKCEAFDFLQEKMNECKIAILDDKENINKNVLSPKEIKELEEAFKKRVYKG